MVWSDLKALVMKRFCNSVEMEKAEVEFLGLSAGNLTHREYTTLFNKLSRLVPHQVDTEAKRIKCYIRGLPPHIRIPVLTAQPTTFISTVELAHMVYDNQVKEKAVGDSGKDKKSLGHRNDREVRAGILEIRRQGLVRLSLVQFVGNHMGVNAGGQRERNHARNAVGSTRVNAGLELRVVTSVGKQVIMLETARARLSATNVARMGIWPKHAPWEMLIKARKQKLEARDPTLVPML